MLITLNGSEREVAPGDTVATLVESLGGRPDGRGVAVALGGEVVPRSRWSSTELPEGAHVEILIAVQGG